MDKPPVFILWDASYLWGLLVFRAMRQLNLNCSLISSKDIAQGSLSGKHAQNGLLIVPGGSARQKFFMLGATGKAKIRNWLAKGGNYIGFCGGAGLALSQADGASLGICPWRRGGYANRLFHLLSGHIKANTVKGPMRLPVWWPGRFQGMLEDGIQILATYSCATKDTCLADMPFELLNSHLASDYGLLPDGDGIFPFDQPLIISGSFGRGKYILSYSHLETPDSSDANNWLQILLEAWGAEKTGKISSWSIWNNKDMGGASGMSGFRAEIMEAYLNFLELVSLAFELDFLYPRKSWLTGWHPGFPGMGLNNLGASLAALLTLRDDTISPCSWNATEGQFKHLFSFFLKAAKECLWTNKLEFALKNLSENGINPERKDRMEEIFGKAMPGGGLIEDLSNLCANYIAELQDYLFRDNLF